MIKKQPIHNIPNSKGKATEMSTKIWFSNDSDGESNIMNYTPRKQGKERNRRKKKTGWMKSIRTCKRCWEAGREVQSFQEVAIFGAGDIGKR